MNLLVGFGGEEGSIRALEAAIERARESGDDLTVAVLDDPDVGVDPDDLEARVEDVLASSGVPADVVRLSGHAGSQLLELAERADFDRIVLGGGETSPLGKVQLGSVAEFVTLNARTSVTLVR